MFGWWLVLAFWSWFGENPGMRDNSGDDALFEIGDDDEPVVVRVPAGRSKVFRRYDPDQSFLMPPSLDDWLPHGGAVAVSTHLDRSGPLSLTDLELRADEGVVIEL